MPRIIVTTDASPFRPETPVLLDEEVQSVHLSSGHAAAQLVQRLAWAIDDAEAAEVTPAARARAVRAPRRRTPSLPPAGHLPIGA
jgi:hypothetical protein